MCRNVLKNICSVNHEKIFAKPTWCISIAQVVILLFRKSEQLFHRAPADSCVWVNMGVKIKNYLHSFNSVQCRDIAEIWLIDSYLVETGKNIALSQTLPLRHFTGSTEHNLQSSISCDISNINLNESSNLSHLLYSMQCAWKRKIQTSDLSLIKVVHFQMYFNMITGITNVFTKLGSEKFPFYKIFAKVSEKYPLWRPFQVTLQG